ncbi:hypothetical protein [Flavihumibacter petaseus]|uniref:Outer membrane protein beta-barrel domain-containing protein n=1 Tax=Flavihumibacter petaseus NBRC 106054 TaxID=1220578 RepID=A0A0E9MV60_9BACT|nr:hypothetical protein [Flavihumibacter petaseus]GAO41326.1 hypothetical protein FPE01S_01_03380 [Flavihumibacter petaseus NBRC 106054]
MKKLLMALALVVTMITQSTAQYDEDSAAKKGFDKSRMFIGGNFGMSFGDYTFINVSPQAGYRFSQMIAAGIGINGQYTQIRTRGYDNETVARSNYGVAGMNIFGRFFPIPQAFLQVQPELNYIWGSYTDYLSDSKSSVNGGIMPSLLLGAGGVLPMGSVGGLMIMVQYDLLNKTGYLPTDPSTPYGNKPFISIGFSFGLGGGR